MSEKKPKDPLIAALFTAILIGWGHVYGKRTIRGVVFFILAMIFTVVGMQEILKGALKPTESVTIIDILLAIFTWLIIIDAYSCTKNYNVKNNIFIKRKTWQKVSILIAIPFFVFTWNISDTIVGIASALYVRQNITQAFKIPTGAMRPTLLEGDRVLVDKRAYKNNAPQRGDIIVFTHPDYPGKCFIKRIVALPNETLEIKDGKLVVNGNIINTPKILSEIHYYNKPGTPYGEEGKKIKISENSYFVLGDNSASSRDSRYLGMVSKEDIIGKADKIYYPAERARILE